MIKFNWDILLSSQKSTCIQPLFVFFGSDAEPGRTKENVAPPAVR